MDNLKLILIIVSCALVFAMIYIAIDKIDICKTEQIRNESYSLGFNQGVEYWNTIIIYNVNNNNVIPYWFNNSYYELNIAQMHGGENE